MSERKIKVPEGMLKAAVKAAWKLTWPDREDPEMSTCSPRVREEIRESFKCALEAALRWLSENPIVPTNEQTQGVCDSIFVGPENLLDPRDAMVEWQRRMFLASPEPRDNPMVQRVVQQFHGVTLSRAEADYIIDQVNMVTHG